MTDNKILREFISGKVLDNIPYNICLDITTKMQALKAKILKVVLSN